MRIILISAVIAASFVMLGAFVAETIRITSKTQEMLERATILKLQQEAANCELEGKSWQVVEVNNKVGVLCIRGSRNGASN